MPLKLLQVFSWVQCWPKRAEDKDRVQTGTLMKCQEGIATIISPRGFSTDAGAWSGDPDSCDRSPPRRLPECFCVQPVQRDLSRRRKGFVSLNGINTLVTFRQPWHNCAINVSDSFAGSSWLVLNHHYVAVCSADALLHRLLLSLLVLLVNTYNAYLNKMYSCIL